MAPATFKRHALVWIKQMVLFIQKLLHRWQVPSLFCDWIDIYAAFNLWFKGACLLLSVRPLYDLEMLILWRRCQISVVVEAHVKTIIFFIKVVLLES